MTVITKSLTEKKSDNLEEPLVENIVIEHDDAKKLGDVELGGAPLPSHGATRYVIGARAKPYYTLIFLLLLLLLGATCLLGIFGTEYLYQRYRYLVGENKQDVYRAWATVTYDDDPVAMEFQGQGGESDVPEISEEADLFSRLIAELALLIKTQENQQSDMKKAKQNKLKAEYELDLEEDRYEKITIPSDGAARFVHDFYVNKTVIVDSFNKRCFVMPLNRSKILTPVSLFDLMFKVSRGYYNVNTEKIRENWHIVLPPIEDLEPLGTFISTECKNSTTYNLEKSETDGLVKRSVSAQKSFEMFAGNYMQYLVSGLE